MRCGYACLAVGVPQTALRTCRKDRADDENLKRLISHNLDALANMVSYNEQMGIQLYRISSDIIPFASSPVNQMPWLDLFAGRLAEIGRKIRQSGQRVSMHPGQYTVINAPDSGVAERALADLRYHAALLDALETGPECKIVLHTGGAYGDKRAAMDRFAARYRELDPAVRRRLVIENDERLFSVTDVLSLSERLGMPVVFDNLHHAQNPPPAGLADRSDAGWIQLCRQTWQPADGGQKIHYAQQAEGKKPGAHADTIRAARFIRDLQNLPEDLDMMLEVKDKNLSAVKCNNCLRKSGKIKFLELEWQRYKYEILEHDPSSYLAVRQLLKDKAAWPVLAFYQLLEDALQQPVTIGHGINAAQHVWGYLNDAATPAQKKQFASYIGRYARGSLSAGALKSFLNRVAAAQHQPYLLWSLYLSRHS